jgi:hypothetical protein
MKPTYLLLAALVLIRMLPRAPDGKEALAEG